MELVFISEHVARNLVKHQILLFSVGVSFEDCCCVMSKESYAGVVAVSLDEQEGDGSHKYRLTTNPANHENRSFPAFAKSTF